jgi:hypothetical protein
MNATELVRWVRFPVDQHGERGEAFVVALTEQDATREYRKLSCLRLVHVQGELVYFEVGGRLARTRFVRLEPSSDAGRRERNDQLGPELAAEYLGIVLPPARVPRPASPIVARLRELADTLDAIAPPAATYASVQLVFEDVTALDATLFATSLLKHVPGSYMETTPSTVAAHVPGRDAEACIELAFPEAPAQETEPESELAGIPLIDTTELDANVAALEQTIAELSGGVQA